MVSTEKALEYLEKKHKAEAEASGQPNEEAAKQPEDTKPETQGTEQTEVQKSESEEKEEPVKTDKPEEKPEEETKPSEQTKEEVKSEENTAKTEKSEKDDTPPKHKYTHEERVAHKFAKQNEKLRKRNEELRERGETIRKQQETIDSLNKELEKYKGLKLEDFENNMEAYADWKAKEASMQNEVKFRKEMMEREQREAAELETARREELSFEDEDEREEYREMLRTNGPQFYDALQKADADYMHPNGKGEIAKAVLGYLSNVDKYPVVLKQLMDLKTGALRKVFSGSKDPEIIRTNLHQLTMELLSEQKKTPESSVAQKQPQGSTKPLPVIGKQVSANSKPSEPVHDRAYWTNYAKTHR